MKELRNETHYLFKAHILTGDDAKVGDLGVHLLPDGGLRCHTLVDTVYKVDNSSDKRMK